MRDSTQNDTSELEVNRNPFSERGVLGRSAVLGEKIGCLFWLKSGVSLLFFS